MLIVVKGLMRGSSHTVANFLEDCAMPLSLAQLRRNYTLYGLRDDLAQDDPLVLFGQWLDQARKTEVPPVEANSMALATVDS